jgi:folate-binding protein YgfZ
MPPTPAAAASRSPYDTLRIAGLIAPFPCWSPVRVTGSDRERFLHSQVTADVRGLAVGTTTLSALLDMSGRLQAFFLLQRRADDLLLLVPDAAVDSLLERLEHHIIADDVTLERPAFGPLRLALGPEALRLGNRLDADLNMPVELYGERGVITWCDEELQLEPAPAGLLETLGILTGLPRWGVDVEPGTLVTETTLMDSAVSLAKGCYLGQETVAKVSSRRGAAFYPVLLRLAEGSEVEPAGLVGRPYQAEGRRAGVVRAVVEWDGARYLQATLYRDLRVAGRHVECVFEEGSVVSATVVPLPLLCPGRPEERAQELYDLAVERFTADAEEEAMVLLERAITVCPAFADAYESLGVILGRLGRCEEALGWMRRLAEVDPASVMAHTNASLYLMRLGRIEEAEHEKAVAATLGLGTGRPRDDAEERARREAEALEADRARREALFRQVLEIDPDDALAGFGLGQLMLERERFTEAVEPLERALAADAAYSAAYLALGRALEGLGDTPRALETYRRGVDVAAHRGDLATANAMQERLDVLGG